MWVLSNKKRNECVFGSNTVRGLKIMALRIEDVPGKVIYALAPPLSRKYPRPKDLGFLGRGLHRVGNFEFSPRGATLVAEP